MSLHKPFQLPLLIKFGWQVTCERNWEQSEYIFLSYQCSCYLIEHIYTTCNFLLKKKLFGHSTFLRKNFSLGILPISKFLTQIMNTAVALIAKETCSREEKHYLIPKSGRSHFWVNTVQLERECILLILKWAWSRNSFCSKFIKMIKFLILGQFGSLLDAGEIHVNPYKFTSRSCHSWSSTKFS